MRRFGRFVEDALDAGLLQGFNVGFPLSPSFAAAVADEHDFDLLFERVHVGDVLRGDTAAAEDPDVGEKIQMFQGDSPGLHAAHGQAGHGPVRLIGQGAIVCINVRNQLINENLLERAEIEPPGAARSRGTVHCGGFPGRSRSGGRGRGRSGATGSATASDGPAIVHHDNERLGLPLGDQVVQDQVGVTLVAPAGFVLPHAVLQIENRIAFGRVLVIIRRSINEAPAHGIGALGKIKILLQLTVRNILLRIEIPVLRGDFNGAAPTAAPVEKQGRGVGDLGPVNVHLIVVETFIQRLCGGATPHAVFPLGQNRSSAQIDTNALGIRSHDTKSRTAFRVDLGILFTALVDRGRFEILSRGPGRRGDGLRQGELTDQ